MPTSSPEEIEAYRSIMHSAAEILDSAEVLLKHQHLRSALMLLFAGIDNWSSLTRPTNISDTSRKFFIKWIEEYFPITPVSNPNAIDFYAARCSLLHTNTAESKLSRKGEARQFKYLRATTPEQKMIVNDIAKKFRLGDPALIIDVDDFFSATKRASIHFIKAIGPDTLDQDLRNRALYHIGKCYKKAVFHADSAHNVLFGFS